MIEAKDFLEFSDLVTQDAQNGGEVNYIVDFMQIGVSRAKS